MLLARAKHRESGFWCLMWLSPQKDDLALLNKFKRIEPEHMPREAVPLVGFRRTFEKFFTYERPPAPMSKSNFICPGDGGPDVFVHISAFARAGLPAPIEGQRVSFDIEPNSRTGKPGATNIREE
jgi:cold shock protein